VFLSGNGPLVAVLREALARDDLERLKKVPATISASEMVTGTLATDPSLHLPASMRSFRAKLLSSFVKALLDGAPSSDRHSGEHRPGVLVV
jgi:hypothetical protein